MTVMHDSSHFSVTHKPWVRKLLSTFHDCYQGGSMLTWAYEHVLGHHIYTNIDGADPDIVTADAEVPDIRRIKWNQVWHSRYFYQHIYVPILYCFLGVLYHLEDFKILLFSRTLRNTKIQINPLTISQWLIFFCSKCCHVTLRFIIPYQFMPLTSLLLYNLAAEMIGSCWIADFLETTHIVSEVEWPKPDKDNAVDMDWAELQVATTQDYAINSWFWTVVTGTVNHQVAHHLFPGVIQSHYPKITPIVKKTCEEFGLKYHYVDTAREAVACHIEHLHKLGQRNTTKKDN